MAWCHAVPNSASKNLGILIKWIFNPSFSDVCLCDIRLMLQFDVSDVTRDGVGVSCQLMVGQSSVPHYQQLEEFTARLAPGEVSVSYTD